MRMKNYYTPRQTASYGVARSAQFVPREDREQVALFEWVRLREEQIPELKSLFHVPNGGRRDKITGAILRRQGVKAGVPDVLLLVPRGGYHGLAIELKRQSGGALSQNQKTWINRLTENGYKVAVCKGAQLAIKEITEYLNSGKDGK